MTRQEAEELYIDSRREEDNFDELQVTFLAKMVSNEELEEVLNITIGD